MFFGDFAILWAAARAFVQGQDPYLVGGFFYPLPTLFVLIPFALLPLPAATALWLGICLLIFVLVLKRRALLWAFFTPTLQAFGSAQFTPLLLGLVPLLRKQRWIGLAIALFLLKPHLIVLAVPLLWVSGTISRRDLLMAASVFAGFCAPAFLLMPDWPTKWVALAISGHPLGSYAPSLWGLFSWLPPSLWIAASSLSILFALVWTWRNRPNSDFALVLSLLVNPVIVPYDLILLSPLVPTARGTLILVLASYGVWYVSLTMQTTMPFVLLSLITLLLMRASAPWPGNQAATSGAQTPPRLAVPR